VFQPGAALLRRQGLDLHAAPGRKGLPPGQVPLPADAHRHRPQLQGSRRLPRQARRRTRRAADRAFGGRLDGPRHRRAEARRRIAQQAPVGDLLEAIEEFGFDACIGGARRDEEKARAKERIFSFRDEFGQWDPKNQRPELWSLYNARSHKGENIRAFPISNWTEMDVWQYIEREGLELPSIYFAHKRPIVMRQGAIVPVNVPLVSGEVPTYRRPVKKSSTCKCVSAPSATSPARRRSNRMPTRRKIVLETATTTITERGATRLDDQTSDASMEQRKKEGYLFRSNVTASVCGWCPSAAKAASAACRFSISSSATLTISPP
jgi:sulfate adenylyltransferase small subunit